jgi:hypothetical protein
MVSLVDHKHILFVLLLSRTICVLFNATGDTGAIYHDLFIAVKTVDVSAENDIVNEENAACDAESTLRKKYNLLHSLLPGARQTSWYRPI